MRNRKELEQHLIEGIQKIKRNKNVVDEIKLELAKKYDILSGDVQEWINRGEEILPNLDIRELVLFTEQIYLKTGDIENLSPKHYFTEVEIKQSRAYSQSVKREEFGFPITFTNVTVVGTGAYMVTMDIQTINKLIESQELGYDYELQREAKFKKLKDGAIRIEPTLNRKNLEEIERHLLEGTLVPTVLVFNAMTRSSETGDELVYDPSKLELTITKGTELSVVDGFHRCRSSQRALQKNPDINFNFAVLITNYSKRRAQQYQAQLAKASKISSVRVQELEANRLSDIVVQQLKEESDLKGRISQTNQVRVLNNELVTYNVMADTIDEEFKLSTRADAANAGDFLAKMFDMLIDSYQEEFINDPLGTKKVSLINDNNLFVAYITIGRRLYEKNMRAQDIVRVISKIDFSRNNPLWQELNVINNEGKIERDTVKLRKNIRKYFNDLNIEEMVNS